jgi:aspartyl-tRNA(Asn)/glutamyl-tRNA(Gln) amidotransferase subunit A
MKRLIERSLIELIAGLRSGEFSSRELTENYLERIHRFESHLHAFLTLTPEKALAQAVQADQAL